MLSILKNVFISIVIASAVVAQIDTGDIPQACVSPCQNLLDLGNTCIVEYPDQGSSPRSTACLCSGIASLKYSSCSSCLTSNSPALAQSVAQLATFCTVFISGCQYECAFDTCASSNVQCQCAEPYLQNIYNCASCNSAHNNANSTLLADYNALHDSCTNQGHTAAPTGVDPFPSPSGTISYTGGGISISTPAPEDPPKTSSHVPVSIVSSASSTTGRVNSGTASTTGGGNPSNSTGGAGKVQGDMMEGGAVPMVALFFVMMVLGDVI